MEKSVFMVICESKYYRDPNRQPWGFCIKPSQGTAVCVENQILTCEHVIQHAITISLKTPWGTFNTSVARANLESDLAVLETPKEIKNKIVSLKLGSAASGDNCSVYGFPIKDDFILAKGQASINRFTFNEGKIETLTLETNEIFKAGNSGGPIVNKGECAGILSHSYYSIERQIDLFSHFIPFLTIKIFLENKHFYDFGYNWVETNSLMKPKGTTRVFFNKSHKDFSTVDGIRIENGNIPIKDFCKKLGFDVKDDSMVCFIFYVSLCGKNFVKLDNEKFELYEIQNAEIGNQEFHIYCGCVFVKLNARNLCACASPGDIKLTKIFRDLNIYENAHFYEGLVVETLNGSLVKDFASFIKKLGKQTDVITFKRTNLVLYLSPQIAKIIDPKIKKKIEY